MQFSTSKSATFLDCNLLKKATYYLLKQGREDKKVP